MKELRYKYVVGCHVMFYEIDILPYYVESLVQAINEIEPASRKNITIDLELNCIEKFEKLDTTKISMDQIVRRFIDICDPLYDTEVEMNVSIVDENKLDISEFYSMINYRRNLNKNYCEKVDWVIWGETDCLAPKQLFSALDELMLIANSNEINCFIATFATRKMWDKSWEPLELEMFKNATYYERHEPEKWENDLSSIHRTMTLDEMNQINDKILSDSFSSLKNNGFDFRVLNEFKFDGSFLCIDSKMIRRGANIPAGFWGLAHEDTAFMYSCYRTVQNMTLDRRPKQIIIKNILKVHNRNHPEKRKYVLNEDGTESTQKTKGEWYKLMRTINLENLNRFAHNPTHPNYITYEQYLNKLNEQHEKIITEEKE